MEKEDRTDLVHAVTKSFQLLNAATRLFIWVITGPDGTHTRRLVPSVALRAVVEIGVRSTRAVSAGVVSSQGIGHSRHQTHSHTDIPCHGDVRASMGLAHDRNHRDLNNKIISTMSDKRRHGISTPHSQSVSVSHGALGGAPSCSRPESH